MPAPEYCFLWIDWWPLCMSKSEWSGWAQAIGAIVALGVAIALPARARLQTRQDAKEMIIGFIAQATVTLEEIRDCCQERDWPTFRAKRLLLQDAAQSGEFLLGLQVNGRIRGIALGLRSSVLDAFHMSEEHSNLGNWPHWHATFAGSASGARALLDQVRELRA